MQLLEAGCLGRAQVRAERAVAAAIAASNDRFWCDRCGATLEASDADARRRCGACAPGRAFDAFVRLGRYDAPLGALARRVKRRGWHAAATALGDRLAIEVRRRLERPRDGWIVVPVPSATLRRLQRGIDHTMVLAEAIGRGAESRVSRALALGASSRQATLGRASRLSRAQRMRLQPRAARAIRGRCVLLVDDIRTTGATLREARELLEAGGARSVIPVVVCVVQLRKTLTRMDL